MLRHLSRCVRVAEKSSSWIFVKKYPIEKDKKFRSVDIGTFGL
jgi:hypothetical protein